MNISLQKLRRYGFFSLLSIFVVSLPLAAETLVYEGFDISTGELDNTKGATSFGWKNNSFGEEATWWAWDQANNDFYHGVADEGLSYEDLPVIGNSFEFRDEETQLSKFVYRTLPKFYYYGSSGHLWLSALFQAKIDGDPDGGGFFQLCLSDFQNDIYMGIGSARDYSVWSAGGERLKVDNVNGEKWGLSDVPVEDGETVFLVMHLDFDTKKAYFWANPDPSVDDPGDPAVEFGMWTDLFVDKVMLWVQNAGPSQEEGTGADYIGSRIDEIRLGDSYASVANGADLTDPGGNNSDTTPPVITGPTGAAGDAAIAVSVEETTVRVGTMTANEEVSWSVSGGDDGDLFTIGLGTGGLSFKEFADFENPGDANGDNQYIVEVTATDTASNTSTQTLTVTITDVENEPWLYWVVTPAGWVSTDADGGSFLDWINVKNSPWIFSYSFNKYFYLNEDNVAETGTWVYAPFSGTVPSGDGDWMGWTATTDGWISTNAGGANVLDWLNVTHAPWLYSFSVEHYIYLPENIASESGSWFYTPITLPPDPEAAE